MAVTLKFFLRPRPKQDGNHPIVLLVTFNRKVSWINTNLSTSKRYWNPKANDQLENWIKPAADDYQILKTSLRNKLRRAQAAIVKLEAMPDGLSLENLKSEIEKAIDREATEEAESKPKFDLIMFWQSQVDLYSQSKSITYAARYQSELNDLKAFLEGKPMPLEDIDIGFLQRFEIFLLKDKGCSRNTVNKKIQRFHKMVRLAIQQGHGTLFLDPFPLLETTWEKTHREKLSIDQIRILEDLDLSQNPYLDDARNIFLAQYYFAGMRIGDALCLRWENVQGDRLVYIMGKTKTLKNIKITPKAEAILRQYLPKNPKPKSFIFPYLAEGLDPDFIETNKKKILDPKTAMINERLKKIASLAGIPIPLSTHISRHSFADNTNKATGNVYAVSRALGHKSLKITETYLAEMDDGSVDDALDQMFGEKKTLQDLQG